MKIKCNSNTMKDELNQVVSKLKGKSETGFDQILEFLFKQSLQYIKKPPISIFNVSINQGIFPDNGNSKNKGQSQKG